MTTSFEIPVLGPLWRYRSFVSGMVVSEFRRRYVGALLGPLWSILTPALLIATYLAIFSAVVRGKLPTGAQDGLSFGLFLCVGIVCWTFFVETVTRCQSVFVDERSLLKKSTFPRLALPVAVLLSAGINFILMLGVFLTVLAFLGRLHWGLLGLVPLVLLQQAFALGLGVFIGTLHVFFRDLGQLTPVALNLWFWLTPIVYPRAIVPDWAQPLISLNPLTGIFEGYQTLVLTGSWDGWVNLWPQLGLAVVMLGVGYMTFRRLGAAMADEL